MWLVRFLLVLGAVAVLGCGEGVTTQPAQEAAPQQQIKSALETCAESGTIDSGLMVVREQAEAMQETDPDKADALLKDLDELESLRDPAQIKAKAKEMLGKL
jgi:hypothetical protein